MTFKKFTFTETSKSLYSSPELLSELAYPANSWLKIELIGIPNMDDPSRLTITIKQDDASKAIRLHDYKAKFIYHNNLYLLDTGHMSDFQIDLRRDFSITVACDLKKEFDMIVYAIADANSDVSILQKEEVQG
jgi:hypothetical protein